MSASNVDKQLYINAQAATHKLNRYERLERFAINSVISGFETEKPVDIIVIQTARMALKNHHDWNLKNAA